MKQEPRELSVEKEESPKPSNIENETTKTEDEAEKGEDTPVDIIPKKLLSSLYEEAERLHNELMKMLGKQDTNGGQFRAARGTTSDNIVRKKYRLKIIMQIHLDQKYFSTQEFITHIPTNLSNHCRLNKERII